MRNWVYLFMTKVPKHIPLESKLTFGFVKETASGICFSVILCNFNNKLGRERWMWRLSFPLLFLKPLICISSFRFLVYPWPSLRRILGIMVPVSLVPHVPLCVTFCLYHFSEIQPLFRDAYFHCGELNCLHYTRIQLLIFANLDNGMSNTKNAQNLWLLMLISFST